MYETNEYSHRQMAYSNVLPVALPEYIGGPSPLIPELMFANEEIPSIEVGGLQTLEEFLSFKEEDYDIYVVAGDKLGPRTHILYAGPSYGASFEGAVTNYFSPGELEKLESLHYTFYPSYEEAVETINKAITKDNITSWKMHGRPDNYNLFLSHAGLYHSMEHYEQEAQKVEPLYTAGNGDILEYIERIQKKE